MNNWEGCVAKLGVGRSTVFALWRTGELGSVTIGKRRFSTDGQIAHYIHKLEIAGEAASRQVSA